MIVVAACGPRRVQEPPARAVLDAGVVVVADAGPPDAPKALADDLPTLAARSADLLDALAEALATPADCATLATAARDVLATYHDVRVAQAAALDRGAGRDLDRALEAYGERVAAAGAKLRPALTACAADADFASAMTPVDVP